MSYNAYRIGACRQNNEVLCLLIVLSYMSRLRAYACSINVELAQATNEYTSIPDELIHKVKFSAVDPQSATGEEMLSITLPLYQLSNKQIVMNYEPETVEDQEIVDSYGGLGNTPVYLVRLRPVLKVDGERIIVARDGMSMGSEYELTIELLGAGESRVEKITNTMIAGNLAAVGIVSQKVVSQELSATSQDKDAERLLYEAANHYIDRWNQAEEELASLLHLTIARPVPTLVTVGTLIDVTYLLDMPHAVTWKGVYMDADHRSIETIDGTESTDDRQKIFMQLSSLQGSILENRIFEDDFKFPSISTAKLFQLATGEAQSATGILTIDITNIDAVLPTLTIADNIKEDITNSVNQNLVIKIPGTESTYYDWTGIGYIKENPETGESGWMLSGMIAGASNALRPDAWEDQSLAEIFTYPLSETPNEDPLSAARIIKMSSTDEQSGTVNKSLQNPLTVFVLDSNGKPVKGATVTFSVIAGGGKLKCANPAATDEECEAISDYTGQAMAELTLGKSTETNPSYMKLNEGDEHYTQVGVNQVAASVATGSGSISVTPAFEGYGKPDAPVEIYKSFGDNAVAKVNNPAGTLQVLVRDIHENPVSNVNVIFKSTDAKSLDPSAAFPTEEQGLRKVVFYKRSECTVVYPLIGDCTTYGELTLKTDPFGAYIDTIMGNTVETEYKVDVAPEGFDAPGTYFTLYSSGHREGDRVIPAYLGLEALYSVNENGQQINASKAGTKLKAPLAARLIKIYDQFEMQPQTRCTDGTAGPCWRLVSNGLTNTETVTNGQVVFTATTGDGAAGNTTTDGSGIYQAEYTTGSVPMKNIVEASGSADIDVPEVIGIPEWGDSVVVDNYDYHTESLPTRRVTLQTGTYAAFDRKSTPPSLISYTPKGNPAYSVYGVEVELAVEPGLILMDENGYSSHDTKLTYTILPDGAGSTETDAAYKANSVDIDIFRKDASGSKEWVQYLIGDASKNQDTATLTAGSFFNSSMQYTAQAVLNRGSDAEVRGEEMPLNFVAASLKFDNAGYVNNDQNERVIRINNGDINSNNVPDFADGLDMFGNQGADASPLFTSMTLTITGNGDVNQVKLRFVYSESDPAAMTRTGSDGAYLYIPAPGSLRIWMKDGNASRRTASAKSGGDYIKAGEEYSLADLGISLNSSIRLYVEGTAPSVSESDNHIQLEIDSDGSGPQSFTHVQEVEAIVDGSLLIPDYNHNRTIDDEDKQRAARGDTFYFWVNDDNDSGETGGDDIPGDTSPIDTLECGPISNDPACANLGSINANNNRVDGVRDLIDFFPVFLNLKDLLSMFDPSEYTYRLKSEENSLRFTFTDMKPDASGDYLTGSADSLEPAITLGGAATYEITETGVALNDFQDGPAFLKKITDEGKGIILFEGRKESKVPLVLAIYNKESGTEVYSISLKLSLAGVEQMFRHKNLVQIGGGQAPAHGTIGGEPDRLSEPDKCPDVACLGADSNSNVNFVFLHGYNVNPQQARGWHSEMFKRMYWSGSKAKFWGVSWFGADTQIGSVTRNYHINVQHAFATAPSLAIFLITQVQGDISIAAHSLGNMVVASALSDYGANVKNYFLIDAAVAMEAYDGAAAISDDMKHPKWEGYNETLWASEWHASFDAGDARNKLTWRNRFGNRPAGTAYYNFYSTGEEVLAAHPYANMPGIEEMGLGLDENSWWNSIAQFLGWSNSSSAAGMYSWALQEKLKGRMVFGAVLGSNYGGWGFNHDYDIQDPSDPNNPNATISMPSEAANLIDLSELKTKPFFIKGSQDNDLFTSSALSTDYFGLNQERVDKYARLLAEALPARTLPAGANIVQRTFGVPDKFNFDMQDMQVNGWPYPGTRINDKWLHSDAKDMAYIYTYGLFEKFVKIMEGMNQ